MSQANVGVVVVAAGAGTRLGADVPKAFVELGGRSILSRALDPIFGMSEPAQVVVVVPESDLVTAQDIVRQSAGSAIEYATVVVGGATRQASVQAGLDELWPDVGVVLVHDAARPFTPTRLFERVIERVRETADGVIPGLPVTDTLKLTDAGKATDTVDRSLLAAVGTPQGFPREELLAAYGAATSEYTDDAALFAAAGHAVHVIEGATEGFKITTPWDLRRAQQLVGERSTQGEGRVGTGVDVHAFDDASPLWLGTVHWAGERGLAGHSDGDAVSHAICDALLSAAGLGDIGSLFGTDDPLLVGAHGDVFLRQTSELLAAEGFRILNVAVQVIGNRPKIGPRRTEVEARLSEFIGAPVSVSATTSDGLGFTGRGEGIAAIATALVAPR